VGQETNVDRHHYHHHYNNEPPKISVFAVRLTVSRFALSERWC